VAFVCDDKIEIAGGILVVDIHHRLQGGDGDDALLVLKAPTGAQYVARQFLQMGGECILGL
jgi:hypothetical protein